MSTSGVIKKIAEYTNYAMKAINLGWRVNQCEGQRSGTIEIVWGECHSTLLNKY